MLLRLTHKVKASFHHQALYRTPRIHALMTIAHGLKLTETTSLQLARMPSHNRDELQWQQPYTGPFDLSQQNYFTLPRTGADENPSAVGGTPGSTISGVGPPQHGALDTRSSSSCI